MLQENRIFSRLIRIMMPLCLTAFIGTIAVYEYYNFSRENLALEEKLEKLASTYSLLYSEPVANNNLDQLQAITISLISDSDIARVTIKDTGTRILDEFTTAYAAEDALAKTIRINYASESGYRRIGELQLVVSKHRLYENLRHRLMSELVLLLILTTTVVLSIFIAFRSSLNRSLKLLTHQANHDALTDLINRRAFKQMLDRIIRNRRITESEHMLMYLDLDNFKLLNDSEGHQAGDDALRQIAALLKSCVREEDFVARQGGDEFTILLVNCSIEDAMLIGDKICLGIRQARFSGSPGGDDIGVSIGITQIDDTGHDAGEFLKRADEACYAAKRSGRNRIEVNLGNRHASAGSANLSRG